MRSIYILITKTDTYISKTIKLLTQAKYTHASISFEKSLQPLYSFSRKYVYLPLPAGLHHEPLQTGFFKKHSHIPCALYEIKVEEYIYQKALNEVQLMLKDAKKYKFSVLGLLLCGCKIPFYRKRHYFCSQFVSEILQKSNALTLPKDPTLMRPNDYTDIPELNCIYEGTLNELVLLYTQKLSA